MDTAVNWRALRMFALVVALATCSRDSPAQAAPPGDEVVFVSPAAPSELALIDRGDRLEIVAPKVVRGGWEVEGSSFFLDWDAAQKRYDKDTVKARVAIRDNHLTFDGRVVTLPDDIKPRAVWQAVLWRGWVLVLGRTSKSDREANLAPPYIANELIAFRTDGSKAFVRWLAPVAMSGSLGLIILPARPTPSP